MEYIGMSCLHYPLNQGYLECDYTGCVTDRLLTSLFRPISFL